MDSSTLYRLLLLALLPVVAVIVYLEGQHYDPGLIQFQSSGSAKDALVLLLPDRIEALALNGVRSFTQENLYEYVNGHAEYFISAGFKGLAVGDYGSGESQTHDPAAVVEIYDMGKAVHAFSILSDESEGNESSVRSEGTEFRTSQGLGFIHGKYYVKVQAYKEDLPLNRVKDVLVGRMGSTDEIFFGSRRFPKMGEPVKTRFIREAYLGLDFLNHVIEQEYAVGEQTVTLALFTEDKNAVKGLLTEFEDFFQDYEISYTLTQKKTHRIYQINDPYEGDWVLVAAEDALFGIYGSIDDRIVDKFLE